MDQMEPLINVLLVLTVLSLIAERLTNMIKLNRPTIRVAMSEEAKEKDRERQITQIGMIISALLAILLKADMFQILARVDAPWETIGWARMQGTDLVRSPALSGIGPFLYAVGGSVVTGVAMGFGSKFWHDMLDIVFNAREKLKQLRQG